MIEGGSCAVEPNIDAPAVDDGGAAVPDNGELVHNFDPSFAPDGRIVFLSTRGNVTNAGAFDYRGPQRSPALLVPTRRSATGVAPTVLGTPVVLLATTHVHLITTAISALEGRCR